MFLVWAGKQTCMTDWGLLTKDNIPEIHKDLSYFWWSAVSISLIFYLADVNGTFWFYFFEVEAALIVFFFGELFLLN